MAENRWHMRHRQKPGHNLHRGPTLPERVRDLAPKGGLTRPPSPRIGAEFLHRVTTTNEDYWAKKTSQEASNVKKRSKEERKQLKAAANREREYTPRTSQHARAKPTNQAAAATRMAASKRSSRDRCATFAAFEVAFSAFMVSVAKIRESGGRFKVSDVPRPPTNDLLGAMHANSASDWRKCWHRALLLWHPDKWAALVEWADDSLALVEMAQAMTRAVIRAKEQGYSRE